MGQIVQWAAPAIAPLIIVAAIPIILVSPDSILDLGFMAYDLAVGDYQAFYLDAMALMIPGVTGLGMLSHADELYDGYRLLNNVDNISDSRYAINYTDNWIDDVTCFNSFSADTTVVTDEGNTPIHQIEIGDYVLAWNEFTDEISFEKVTDTIHHTDEVVVYLTIDGEEIETTPEHPFYVEGAGWTNAEDLQLGDEIRNADGETGEIESITIEEVTQEMYNLTVDEAHTFFVGDGQWLVHNTECNWLGKGDAPQWGRELAEQTDDIYRLIPFYPRKNSTIALTNRNGLYYVTSFGDTRAAIFLANNQNILNFKHVPNNSPYHAEVFLYKHFNGSINGIGVSHRKGPCMEDPYFCKKFFVEEGFQNVFWTGLWK